MCERNHPNRRHLKQFVPFCLAGLLVGVACGAPDEVKRASVSAGGQTTGAGGKSGSGGASTPGSTNPTTGGTTSAPPSSSADSGGTTATGGKGGTVASSKGGSSVDVSTGGSTTSSKSGGAGGSGGASIASSAGGSTGGTTGVSTGGASSVGGTSGGTTSTSTTPTPTSGLAVNVRKPIVGATGAITFNELLIENKNAQSVDLSLVAMRYWYQDEGFSASPELATYYVSIGNSGGGKLVDAKVSSASPALPGADHYFEFSVSGTLLPQNDKSGNDKMTLQFALHTKSYSEKVDLTNDYSYSAGATGYNERMTLHSGGKVIWGTPPGNGGEGSVSPDAGTADAAGVL